MTGRICAVLLLALSLMTGAVTATPYPGHTDLYVTDLAGVLPAEATARLRQELSQLKAETGVEMTVLTIGSRQDYDASPSIEAFATGLFNDWGIGRARTNDGILVLVAVKDHEMRLELGRGYDQGYDVLAQDIVNRWFLPGIRSGDYAGGIEAGVGQTIDRIARPHAKGLVAEAPPAGSLMDRIMPYLFGLVAATMLTLGLFGRQIGDWSYRFRRCPVCGQTGLHRAHVLQDGTMTNPDAATTGTAARPATGIILTTCPHCSYSDRRPWQPASQPTGRSGGSFGGGRSSGGGASGRW